ncbi:MAG: twin-arginine translocation signal domain-containing protein, partial [Acidimicrobiia bacterium]|nr:twin-arginine translocation signal domain-containing protein [Acidimicrobiia bacterium]
MDRRTFLRGTVAVGGLAAAAPLKPAWGSSASLPRQSSTLPHVSFVDPGFMSGYR